MAVFELFPGAAVVFFAVDFGEGGIEGFGDGLEAVIDFPTDIDHQGDSAGTVDRLDLANAMRREVRGWSGSCRA